MLTKHISLWWTWSIFQKIDYDLQVEWMDVKTKQSALEKADSINNNIAYPAGLLDDKKLEKFFEKLEINPDNYF